MKKGSKKIIILELFLLLLLSLNSFIPSILSGYKLIILLIILIIIFKTILGFEKDHNRYTKDILFDLLVILVISLILYYLMGIFIGFAKVPNYYNKAGIINFILPLIISIIIKEYLRYNFLLKTENSNILTILTIITFILLDLVNVINIYNFRNIYDSFLIICIYILPTISNNILCTYMSKKVGYKPCIFYLLVINLYKYLLPIIPNFNDYIYSIILLIYPIIILLKISTSFEKVEDKFILKKEIKKNHLFFIICSIIIITIICISSGYFKYYAIAIGSDSMNPEIKKGDIVIIKKNKNVEKEQVIAYRYEGNIVVHRIVKTLELENETIYYTKGDANQEIDNWQINKDMIIGNIVIKLPYLGLPSIWLNNL